MAVTFRAGVGAVVVDAAGRALVLERADVPGAWQLPQGGIDDGERPLDALWRELREETGLGPEHVELVHEVPEWLGYELPAGMRKKRTGAGQVHKWFVLRARDGAESAIRLDVMPEAEFVRWRWVDLAGVAGEVVSFRAPVYRRLAAVLAEVVDP